MKTQSYTTKSAKNEEIERKWYVVDAEGEIVGRLASRIADVLRGKHKPLYTPHVDCGDFIVVVNAEKIRFTGNKEETKEYLRYSGYQGGLKKTTVAAQRAKKPEVIIEKAVRGMMPKNKLAAQVIKKLLIYPGAHHPHMAQKPEPLKF